MRKLLSFCIALILLIALAMPASAAISGFLYDDVKILPTEEVNDLTIRMDQISQQTGIAIELYVMEYAYEEEYLTMMADVIYDNKEVKPEEYISVWVQIIPDATGMQLSEEAPWYLKLAGSIAENAYLAADLQASLEKVITAENFSGALAEDQFAFDQIGQVMMEAAVWYDAERSAPPTPYVMDHAYLLSPEQRQELNVYAEKIEDECGMGVYVMSVPDFHDYGEEFEIYDVLWNYYHDNSLGYGENREGMILMLSMAERDYATFCNGENLGYVFDRFGQYDFLNFFGSDDWYGGFRAYLASAEKVSVQYDAQRNAPATPHVIDDAYLLTQQQRQELNAYATEITNQYGIGVYMMSVPDFCDYGEEFEIYDVLWNYYHDNGLGCGEDREGMILMLSMADRDWATFYYGENTEYAFNSYGQKQHETHFLDNFGKDDWHGGFQDYLASSEDFLAKAADGEPVRDNPWHLALVFILIAWFIAFIVTRLLWMRMANVATQKSATRYISQGGLILTHQKDVFLHQTQRRRKIERSDSDSSRSGSSSRAHTGGGGSGRSGKF